MRNAALIGALTALLWAGCTTTNPVDVAGGGSDIGNGSAIAGTVKGADQNPASNALVRIRPSDYIPGRDSADSAAYDVRTDERGRFRIAGLDSGEYVVEALTGDQGALATIAIDGSDSTFTVDARLAPVGAVRVTLPYEGLSEADSILAVVLGVEHAVTVSGASVEALIEGVPPGRLAIALSPLSGALPALAARNIELAPADEAVVAKEDFFCADRSCDSTAFLQFLEANGLAPYISRWANDSGRIADIELSWIEEGFRLRSFEGLTKLTALRSLKILGRYLPDSLAAPLFDTLALIPTLRELHISWTWDTVFNAVPPAIAHLTQLTTLRLNGNGLDSLPAEIGNLTNLRTLGFTQNRLTELPPAIGNCINLRELDFSFNNIAALPEEIYGLPSLTTIVSWENPLCSLTKEQKEWLETKGPDARAGPCHTDSTQTDTTQADSLQ